MTPADLLRILPLGVNALPKPVQRWLVLVCLLVVGVVIVPVEKTLAALQWIGTFWRQNPWGAIFGGLGASVSANSAAKFIGRLIPSSTAQLIPLDDLRASLYPRKRRTLPNGLRYDISQKKGIVAGPFCPGRKYFFWYCDTKLSLTTQGAFGPTRWTCHGCDRSGEYRGVH
jgi:hypothetical protein